MPELKLPSLAGHTHLFADTETTGLTYDDKPTGLSYCTIDGIRAYAAWGHQKGGNNVDRDAVVEWWNREVIGNDLIVVFHNAVFDLRMLVSIGCKIPRRVEDTCVIAALLDEFEPSYKLEELSVKHLGPQHVKATDDLDRYCEQVFGCKPSRSKKKKSHVEHYWKCPGDMVAPYAEQDANLTRLLWIAMRKKIDTDELTRVHDLECRLIPILVRMYRAGVRVDLDKALALKQQLSQEHHLAHSKLTELNGGIELNTESTPQVARFLERFGIAVEKTEAGNPSVTRDFLKTIDHPSAALITTAKRTRHYSNVFIDSYILDNVTPTNFIYPSFHQTKSAFGGTVTGRFSSAGGLNAQNIPKRDSEWAPRIRGLFIPAYDGGQWLRLDYSQIEYRFFAHYAGGAVMQRYNEDPTVDFHQMVADLCGIPRGPAKNINFGFLFGMGEKKLARQLNLPMDEAREIFEKYHSVIPEAKLLSQRAMNRASSRGYIITWGGRKCRFMKFGRKYAGTHAALNYVCQGSAADLIKTAMVAVDQAINWEDEILHLTVHDELDLTVPPGDEGMASAKRIKEAMEGAGQLRVPVRSEAELGADWGHTDIAVA